MLQSDQYLKHNPRSPPGPASNSIAANTHSIRTPPPHILLTTTTHASLKVLAIMPGGGWKGVIQPDTKAVERIECIVKMLTSILTPAVSGNSLG